MLSSNPISSPCGELMGMLLPNQTQKRKIFTINQLDNQEGRGRFKEVYIRRGATGEVYGVEVSLFQYLTYTTEKPEKSAVEIYANAFGGYKMGLDAFVADFTTSNLSLHSFFEKVNKEGAPLTDTFLSPNYRIA